MRSLLFLLFSFFVCCARTAPIDSLTARQTAQAFFRKALSLKTMQRPLLRHQAKATYLFSLGDNFILTAADDALPEVIGYGRCRDGHLPPALKDLIHDYDRALRLHALRSAAPMRPTAPPPHRTVAPLLQTIRHQEAPFNALCPYYLQDDGTLSSERCIVGCVATALEQIVAHYKRPISLLEPLRGWSTPHYTVTDVAAGSQVDTRRILDVYDDQSSPEACAAVATLSYWLGLAVHMKWGLNASSANSQRAAEPLRRSFGWQYVHYVDSYRYAPDAWLPMLYRELESGRPIYYAGSTMRLNGHAFIIDGVDKVGRFHVLWGYGGQYDGYFDLNVLCAAAPAYDVQPDDEVNGFFCNQEALLLHPDAQQVAMPDSLERTGSEIVVDSIRWEAAPRVGTYTPLRLYVHNAAPHALTTPLVLFTNLQTDTAAIQQGDFIGLTGLSLEAGAQRELLVHVRADAGGQRLLRITQDGVSWRDLASVNITPAVAANLNFELSTPTFLSDHAVRFVLSATAGDERVGALITYELTAQGEREGTRHGRYLYVAAGETAQDTVHFQGLKAGEPYTLSVRYPWAVVKQISFTMPTTGLSPIHKAQDAPAKWIDTNGRATDAPQQRGVYIYRGKKVFRP